MMFRRDQAMIPRVTIHGREWTVRVTPAVHIVPISGAEPLLHEIVEAECWFLANQHLFDLEGLT